jgi:4-hydroxy-tetrahydrodipicolinate synthase
MEGKMVKVRPIRCITALVTPFRGERVDMAGLRKNIRFQLAAGVEGLLACGSTGESPTLSEAEYESVVGAVVAEARSRALVVAGCGTNSTARSVRQAKVAKSLGARVLLVVAPYYNKPTPEGLYRHFRTIADSTDAGIIIYNIPPRSVVNIAPATVERLVNDCPNVIGVKEASGSLDQSTDILARCAGRITLFSGDDSLTLPMMAVGGHGVISVVSNIVPADVVRMCDDFAAGCTAGAAVLHRRLYPLIKAMFIETNPTPVKAAMSMLGMAAGEPRLPLVLPTREHVRAIRQALVDYGLRPVKR